MAPAGAQRFQESLFGGKAGSIMLIGSSLLLAVADLQRGKYQLPETFSFPDLFLLPAVLPQYLYLCRIS